jgi:Family of unknown function (DUF6448)
MHNHQAGSDRPAGHGGKANPRRLVAGNTVFFPVATAYAIFVLPASVLAMPGLTGALPALASVTGHAHEMLFGFALAVVVLAAILYAAGKSLAQFFGLDDPAAGFLAQSPGIGDIGLKPAGRDLGPPIPAADRALEDGSVDAVVRLVTDAVARGIRERFKAAWSKRRFDPNDVEAGREYVEAYVPYIHFVERLFDVAKESSHGHFHESEEPVAHVH